MKIKSFLLGGLLIGLSASYANATDYENLSGNYKLVVDGTAGTEITVATLTQLFQYTPSVTGEVTFNMFNGDMTVFEGTTFKGYIYAQENPATFAEITANADGSVTNNILEDGNFYNHSDETVAANKWKLGSNWETNISYGEYGIRVGTQASAVDGIVFVWRGANNSNYFAQKLSNVIAPNSVYKFICKQVAGGNANADFKAGLGTSAGNLDYGYTTLKLGDGYNGEKNGIFTTPATVADDVYFSFVNTNVCSSGSDPVTQLDYVALVKGTPQYTAGLHGATEVFFASDQNVFPSAINNGNFESTSASLVNQTLLTNTNPASTRYSIPDFWNINMAGNSCMGVYAYGNTEATLNGQKAPTDGPVNGDTYCFGTNTSWSSFPYLYQTIELATGDYILEYDVYATTTSNFTNKTGVYSVDMTETYCVGSNATAPETWESYSSSIFSVDASTVVKIVVGYQAAGVGSGNTPKMYFDNIVLRTPTDAERAAIYADYVTARNAAVAKQTALGENPSIAIASALAQYTQATALEAYTAGIDKDKAIAILNNAVTMADAEESANGLMTNADFTGGISSMDAMGGGQVEYPKGWTFERNFSGWNDCSVKTIDEVNVFNMWAGTINTALLTQVVNNIPDGLYEISAAFKNDVLDGTSGIGIFADETGTHTGRSVDVGSHSASATEFKTYSAYVEVSGNKMQVGIYSNKGYYQVKNFQVKMIADNAANRALVANCRIYQDLCWNRDAFEYDFTNDKYNGAADVDFVMMQNANAIIKANSDIADKNVVVSGTCANFVLTDAEKLVITNGFSATNATYTRATFVGGWNAIVLPFEVPYATWSANFDAIEINTLNAEKDAVVMNHLESEAMAANTPYLIKKKATSEATSINFAVSAVTVNTTASAEATGSGAKLVGVYEPTALNGMTNVYGLANGEFHKPSAENANTLKPFRAYLQLTGGSSAPRLNIVVDETEGINAIEAEAIEGGVFYDLQGRKVENPTPGFYIFNGRKVIIK